MRGLFSFIVLLSNAVVGRAGWDPSMIKKILVIEVNRLGDAVNSIPAIKTLKYHLHEAELWLLVHESFVSLFQSAEIADNVIGLNDEASIFDLLRTVRKVRKEKFDLVCSLSPIQRNALLTVLGRTKYAVGYLRPGRKIPNFLKKNQVYSIGIQLPNKGVYEKGNIAQTALAVCFALGFSGNEKIPRIAFSEDTLKRLLENLHKDGIHFLRPYVVIHPFAGWKYRQLASDRVAALAREIISEYKLDIVFVGAKSEESALENLSKKIDVKERIRVIAGTNLDNLAVILKRCVAFIGMDSGPIHLASALGTPCIGIYGPAPPELTGPINSRNLFVCKPVECSPCNQYQCIRPDNSCLNLITVEEIFNVFQKSINEKTLN